MTSEGTFLYRAHSTKPLQKLVVKDLEMGMIVYTSAGDCFICSEQEDTYIGFTKIHDSVLNEGECIEDLSETALMELFWPLSDKMFKKYYNEIKDTGTGEEEVSDNY